MDNDKIIAFYEDYTQRKGEDNRPYDSRSAGLEFHYTKKAMDGYINENSRVLEIGCGTGYYGMHYASKCKEYVGVDLYHKHIEIYQQKIDANGHANHTCHVGDATKLANIENNRFDVVCCFGPMYHLPPDGRQLALAECRRVCKPGGVVALAYINKLGVYVGVCIHDEGRDTYPNKATNEFVLRHGTDDMKPDIFFFTMPEEIEAAAARHGLQKLRNVGTDYFITKYIVDRMDDEKFALYREIADEMFMHESCTGMSNHALLICRKG